DPDLLFGNPARVPQIHGLLDRADELMILIRRIVAKHIHIGPGTLLDHRQPDAPRPDDRDRLPRNFITQKRQIRMPIAPLVLPRQMLRRPHPARQRPEHKKSKLRRSLGQHVRSIGERNFVPAGIAAIDVVESHGNLRHHLQRSLARLEDLRINLIAQRRNQPVNAGLDLLDNDLLRRRLRMRINFHLVPSPPQQLNRLPDITSRKHPEFLAHVCLAFLRNARLPPSCLPEPRPRNQAWKLEERPPKMPLRTFSRESEIDCFYNVARFGGRHVLDSFTENRLLYRCFPPVAYGWRTLPVEVPVNSGSSAAERQLHLLPDDESFVSTVVHNAGIYNGI